MSYQERRRAERFRVNVDALWESSTCQRKGTISDISTSGCFVLTSPQIQVNEAIEIGIKFPNGKDITLSGEAVYAVEEIGFALRFTELGERERRFLHRLIDSARKNLAQ
ncbi:MAG TPA: PilZ domain-containing protein [Pyrinomonadaceae bacterium]